MVSARWAWTSSGVMATSSSWSVRVCRVSFQVSSVWPVPTNGMKLLKIVTFERWTSSSRSSTSAASGGAASRVRG